MKEEGYSYIKGPEIYHYEFFSEGPNGKIRKVIQYQLIDENNHVFNLAFGDWNEEKNTINDLSKSNNLDRQKILVTVAQTVIDFLNVHPYAIIIATGSTKSRTRLYQMGISLFWEEIKSNFYIDGYINDQWEAFEKKQNYEAFSLKRK